MSDNVHTSCGGNAVSVHFSSKKSDWETPDDLFQQWNNRWGPFTLDVCATPENTKCNNFYEEYEDSLLCDWYETCWMNPPYGRQIGKWVQKAYEETRNGNVDMVCCLLPCRTDTRWWHTYVLPHAWHIEYLKGRIKFKGAKNSAPFPSAIVIFKKPA